MKFFSKTILTLSVITTFVFSPVAYGFVTLPPAPIPVMTADPVHSITRGIQSVKYQIESTFTMTNAQEWSQKAMDGLASFGSTLVSNLVGSISAPETSQTVAYSMGTTDDSGETTVPDNLKDQKATKKSAEEALTLKDEADTEMSTVQKVRSKIPDSKRNLAVLGLASSWVLSVEAATLAYSYDDEAQDQIHGQDQLNEDLRSQITINNNINMHKTSNMNRLLYLDAIRSGIAGYNGLEKSGTLQHTVVNMGQNAMDGVTGGLLGN